MDMVRKCFGKKTSQGFNNGEEESWGIWRDSYVKIVDESILFYSRVSLKILSRNSLSFVGIRGIYTGVRMECEESGFSKQGWLAAWLSREIQPRDNRTASCPILSCSALASMTLQLLACLAHALLLAAWNHKSPVRSSRESLFSCTLLSISTLYLTHYPYNNPT